MKILFITPTPPTLPASDGLALIGFYVLHYLQTKHTVTCLTSTSFSYQRSVWQHYLTGHYLTRPWYSENYTAPQITAYIKNHAGEFDVIYLHSALSLQYVSAIKNTPVVVGLIDTMSAWFRQASATSSSLPKKIHLALEAKASARLEQTLQNPLIKSISVVTATDKALLPLADKTKVVVIPNGVDLQQFIPARTPPPQPTIIFTGIMDYAPNIDAVLYFYRNIWPQLRNEAITWYIVGKRPTSAITALAKQDNKIIVTGEVPSIAAYLQRATIYIAPLRFGAGIKNKLLEALACGLPIVALPAAVSGLETSPMITVETPRRGVSTETSFAKTITNLLHNPKRCHELGQTGRQYVEQHHRWDDIARQYEQLLQNVVYTPQ